MAKNKAAQAMLRLQKEKMEPDWVRNNMKKASAAAVTVVFEVPKHPMQNFAAE